VLDLVLGDGVEEDGEGDEGCSGAGFGLTLKSSLNCSSACDVHFGFSEE